MEEKEIVTSVTYIAGLGPAKNFSKNMMTLIFYIFGLVRTTKIDIN